MTSLGFENYAEALKIYLSKYREVMFPLPFLMAPYSRSLRTGRLNLACDRTLTNDQQSQSNRGENQQNRPSSQGYGASAPGGPNAAGSSGFQGGEAVEGGGESYMYQGGHNGAAGETY